MITINKNNVLDYIDLGIIDPTKVKIDLNKNKTTSDNNHRWITLLEAIDAGYDFNFDYEDKKPVKEKTLPEVEVIAAKKKPNSAFEDTLNLITSILNTNRVKNMLKASPEVMDNWRVAENALEGINYASGGFLNRLSPTLNVGFVIDAIKGNNLVNSWFGNSGITSEEFAEKYPYLAMAINTAGDFGAGYGLNKFLKWGTTPKLIGSGAEFDVETAPWWSYVKKTGDIPPNEVELKNSIAGMMPMKYVGKTPEGLYLYTLKKVIIPKKLPKSIHKLYNYLVDNLWFPNRLETNLDFISPVRKLALLDVDTGNVGYKNWFDYLFQRRPVIIDNAVLEMPAYFALYEKKGGRLIPKNRGGGKTKELLALERSRKATEPNDDFSKALDLDILGKVKGFLGYGPTCTNTATSFYYPNKTTAGSKNLLEYPERSGFKIIDLKEAVPGSIIVISNPDGTNRHSVIFDSVHKGEPYWYYNKNDRNQYYVLPGDTLVNYSNGKRGEENYRKGVPLNKAFVSSKKHTYLISNEK